MRYAALKLLIIILISVVLAAVVPVTSGYDVRPSPTPTDETVMPAASATPAPAEATAEATRETVGPVFINPYADIPFSYTTDGAPVLGNPDAPITIIEFADFACPFCQHYEPTMHDFIDQYVATGRAKFEFRIFPTAGGQMTAFIGSLTSCLADQEDGVFWPMHDEIYAYAVQGRYDADMIKEVASHFDLDYEAALKCLGQQGKPLQAETDTQFGRSLSVKGTPAIRVRYKDFNDEQAQYLIVDGQLHDKGGPPLNVLAKAVEDAEAGNFPDPEMTPEVPIMSGSPV